MTDDSVDLGLVARQQRQMVSDMGSLKDDMGVTMAMLTRLDGTVARLINEIRAPHARHHRLDNRVRVLEAAESDGETP